MRIRSESGGDLVERLVVCPELMRFESALRDRMGRLANFRHVRYPRVRAVERTGSGEDQTVTVVTDAVRGHRLATLLDAAATQDLVIDVNAALQVARELLPALSVLHDSRAVTHGALGPERIILTPEARIAVVDHTVGLALERLRFPRSRLWREFRIAMPPSAGLPQFDQRADVAQVAMVILALVLGRPIGLQEFPDGLRTLATETPERLGGGAARPMTASLRAWFERALPLESRRPFATALEAQIALESVVTREVAYSPRPGALRTLLHRYEELRDHGVGASPDAARERDAGSASDRQSTQEPGNEGPRVASTTSPRRRGGGKGRKAPTADELEAQEIARLEAELARLMSLEAAAEPGAAEQPTTLGTVVPFPGHSDARVEMPDAPPKPVAPSPEPRFVDVPSTAQRAPDASPEVASVVGHAAETEPPLGEEEVAALNALLEIETQASVPPEATAPDGVECARVSQSDDVVATDVVLEVDLDAALEALIADALQAAPADTPVWAVDAVEAVTEPAIEVASLPADALAEQPSVAEEAPPNRAAPEFVVPEVVPPEVVVPDVPVLDIAEPELVELQGEAWSLASLTEEDAITLARLSNAEAEATAAIAEPARDEFTRVLDFESAPEPVALALVRPYHRRLGAARRAGRSLSTTDVARLLALAPRVVEGDSARAVPLRRRPAPRRPAALAGAPEPAGALATTATRVFATLAVYQPAGALVAPAALVASTPDVAEEVAPLEALVSAELPAPAEVETEQIPDVWVEAVEPAAIEVVELTDVAPLAEVLVDAAVEIVPPAELLPAVRAEVDVAVEAPAPDIETAIETALSIEGEPTTAVEVVAPVEPSTGVDTEAEEAIEAAGPSETAPSEQDAVSVVEPNPTVEVDATRVRRRKRRRKKSRRMDPDAVPVPVEVMPPVPSPDPVAAPVAPWLRGRDLAPAPPRPVPAVVAPQPPAPVAPISAAPPWSRRGREPLPVLPSTERPQTVEASVTPPVAPLGDALSGQDSAVQPPTVTVPEVPKAVASLSTAPPRAEAIAREAPVEPPQDGSAHVLTFPARRPRMTINWRRTIAASIVIMLIEGGAFATAYWYVKPREVGYLLVNSTVAGLDVSIDGKVQGKTPLSLELPPGRHTIELRGQGVTKAVPVEIAPNVQTSQMIAWSRPAKVGRLSLKTTPAGAQVMVDGQPRGLSPLTIDDLPAGPHQVVAQNESGTVEQTVRVVADETLEIDVPIYSGWLALFAPVEVRIFEDGRLLGTSLDGRILMSPGRHRLELVNQRLGLRQIREVVIQPGRVLAVSVEAPRGTMVIEAPSGTSVSVDGVAMGVTPLGELSVEVGTREILFQHPELGQRRVTVTVGVGAPARVNMLAPR